MNLNRLECFLMLAKTLSFTETAQLLSLTQPSVSRQIQLLEEELKTKLFIRDRHSVKLSPEGKSLRVRIAPLVEQMARVVSESREESEAIRGPIHFGCLPEIGQNFFSSLVIDFQKLHPSVDIHLHYVLEHQAVALLKEGELDFGVVSTPMVSESLRTYKLIEERSIAVTRTKNKDKLSNLSQAKFVAYSKWDGLLIEYLNTYHKGVSIAQLGRLSTANSHRSMLQFLQATDSFAILPYFTVQAPIEKKELRIASDKELRKTMYLLQLETPVSSKKHLEFRKFMIDRCRAIQFS